MWSKLVVVVIHKKPGVKQIKTKQWNFAQKNTNIYLREKLGETVGGEGVGVLKAL